MLPAFLRRSVRGKMLAVVLATTLTALLANAAALLYYNIDDYRRTRLADVRTQAEILGRASAAALASGSGAEAERDLAVLQARPDVVAAALYGRDGKLLAAYRRDPEAAVPGAGGGAGPPYLGGPAARDPFCRRRRQCRWERSTFAPATACASACSPIWASWRS